MPIIGKLFGTDGIRGEANTELDPLLVTKIGMALGQYFKDGEHQHTVLIGKDTRRSGYMIENSLVGGLTAAGMNTFVTGPIPTPGLARMTRSMRADLGIMISASHNPFGDNGIKIFDRFGYKLSDEIEAKIADLVGQDLLPGLKGGREVGRNTRRDDAQRGYIEAIKMSLSDEVTFDGLRIAVDAANGAAYMVAPTALAELGADVVAVGNEPDGFNINDNVGSTSIGLLRKTVKDVRADVGVALDGDADRVIFVDELGNVIDGDQILALVADSWLEAGRLNNKQAIVATIMSNIGLERYLNGKGIELVRSKVGDRYVLEQMRTEDINLGGEQSGHIIMTDYATTGDGLLSTLQVLAVLKKLGRRMSEIAHKFDPLPQLLENVRYKRGSNPLETPEVAEAIKAAEASLSGGRIVVRPSGTEPVIRVMAEGDDEAKVKAAIKQIIETIDQAG